MFTVSSGTLDLRTRLYISKKSIEIKLLLINLLRMRFLFLSRASNPKDPPTVTQAREQELELIRKFIQ